MTKYVISGYIGFDNFGDEAIAGVLTGMLKKNNAEKITVISSNPEKTSELYGVNSVKMLDFIKPILECDCLISGGGSLLQDVTSLKSLIYYLAIIMTAKTFGKKVKIFAQGFTPFRTKIGKFLTGFVLKHCNEISVRDEKSQNLLKEMGVESKLVCDPVFGIEVPKTQKNGVGIQLRSFDRLSEEFVETLIQETKKMFPDKEIKLISLQDSLDLPVLQGKGNVISGLNVKEVIEEISGLEYLIGMRFHACLIGAKAGVKVLGLNYDIKVETLAKKIGFPVINLEPDEIKTGLEALIHTNPVEYKIPECVLEV